MCGPLLIPLTAVHQAADLIPVHDNQPFGRQPA
nr:MAG TPA: hypothetical protein [Caudoviricetes sp.]